MQFPDNIVTEITVPNTVPFLPGNDVIGIGTDIPAELAATNIKNALIFYNSGWNPASTFPEIKFFFIAGAWKGGPLPGTPKQTGMAIGYGIVPNPSVNQTAVIVEMFDFSAVVNGAVPNVQNAAQLFNVGNHTIVQMISQAPFDTDPQGGLVETFSDNGTLSGSLPP